MDDLPGAELVAEGVRDHRAGRTTTASLLVQIGATRLRALGVDVPEPVDPDADHRLWALLAQEDADSAHSRYNALVRRLVSYERARGCAT